MMRDVRTAPFLRSVSIELLDLLVELSSNRPISLVRHLAGGDERRSARLMDLLACWVMNWSTSTARCSMEASQRAWDPSCSLGPASILQAEFKKTHQKLCAFAWGPLDGSVGPGDTRICICVRMLIQSCPDLFHDGAVVSVCRRSNLIELALPWAPHPCRARD